MLAISRESSITPTEVCKQVTEETMMVGLWAGLSSLGGYALNTPIGAGNSALYGVFIQLFSRSMNCIADYAYTFKQTNTPHLRRFFCTDPKNLPSTYKIIKGALLFFGSTACAWGVTNTILNTANQFSFPDALALSGTTLGIALAIILPFACCIACCKPKEPSREEEEAVVESLFLYALAQQFIQAAQSNFPVIRNQGAAPVVRISRVPNPVMEQPD